MEGSEGSVEAYIKQSLSFSITKSVATKHPVDVQCYITTHCLRLLANVTDPIDCSFTTLPTRTYFSESEGDDAIQWANGKFNPLPCPNLPNGRPPPPIRQMESLICDERSEVCVGGGGMGRRACGHVSLSLQSPLVSPTIPPPLPSSRTVATHRGLSRAGTGTERTGGWPDKRRRSLIAGVWLCTKTNRLQYYEQFHTVTK